MSVSPTRDGSPASAGHPGKRPAELHAGKGSKRPRVVQNDEDVPDLADYFHSFDMTKKQQIAVCRTYANHLAAAIRAVLEED